MDGHDSIRIGTRERDHALAALSVHHEAGRLDAFELEDRCGRVRDAVTRGEVRAVFADLPHPGPDFEGDPARRDLPTHPAAGATGPGGSQSSSRPGPYASRRRRSTTVIALAPFIGLAACLVARSWVGLLLIPVVVLAARHLDT